MPDIRLRTDSTGKTEIQHRVFQAAESDDQIEMSQRMSMLQRCDQSVLLVLGVDDHPRRSPTDGLFSE
jgi:hypothetical protein